MKLLIDAGHTGWDAESVEENTQSIHYPDHKKLSRKAETVF